MKEICLIGQDFDGGSGQGVYRYSCKLFNSMHRIHKGVKKKKIGTSRSPFGTIFLNTFGSLYAALRGDSDVYHFMMPEVSLPCLFKRRCVVTIHDLIPLKTNERRGIFNIYFKIMMMIALKADHIIAVSDSTKRDLKELFKINEDKISVIYEGVDNNQFYPRRTERRDDKFYVGYLGGLGKRKNVEAILQVAGKLRANKRIIFKIAGKGPQLENLKKIAKELRLDNVEFLGMVPDSELREFYSSLDLFIFPSLYEGFGLPLLEAMGCGIPTIASNRSSIPEVLGGVGLIFDPFNIDEIKGLIEKILADKRLADTLVKKGIKRVEDFDWEKNARETLGVYEKVCKNEKDNKYCC